MRLLRKREHSAATAFRLGSDDAAVRFGAEKTPFGLERYPISILSDHFKDRRRGASIVAAYDIDWLTAVREAMKRFKKPGRLIDELDMVAA